MQRSTFFVLLIAVGGPLPAAEGKAILARGSSSPTVTASLDAEASAGAEVASVADLPAALPPDPEPIEVRHQSWSQILKGHAPHLSWPLSLRALKFVTSPFGERVHPIEGVLRKHTGVDLAATLGQPVQAAAPGRVVSAGWLRGHGYQVEVQHAGGVRTRYSHLSGLLVEPGAMVEAGSALGLAGATGMATGVHLHFEVWKQGQAKNPMAWFRKPRSKTQPTGRARAHHQYVARPHHTGHGLKGSS